MHILATSYKMLTVDNDGCLKSVYVMFVVVIVANAHDCCLVDSWIAFYFHGYRAIRLNILWIDSK